jgi:hypothetical protein
MQINNNQFTLIRALKNFIWNLVYFIRKTFLWFLLKSVDGSTLIKVCSNPFKYNRLKIINPVTWFKILINRDRNFPSIKILKIPQVPVNGHVYFYISRILKFNPKIKRIGLIFFMGIGDYFYATSFIEYFKSLYPDVFFDAYVSKNTDKHNSTLVGECLKVNPFFENVYYYNGYLTNTWWKNYDYSECYKISDSSTLLLPMIYEYNLFIKSRFEALCKTFMLPTIKTSLPKIYTNYFATENVQKFYSEIKRRLKIKRYKAIVFVQMSARSTNYTYPYTESLIKNLIDDNYFVITVENVKIKMENFIYIDINKININETIKLLSLIKNEYSLYFMCVISLFASISAGLKAKALILHHFYDKSIRSVWFPSIYIIGNRDYFQLPKKNVFVAKNKDYEISNGNFYTYSPSFVMHCFAQIFDRGGVNGATI